MAAILEPQLKLSRLLSTGFVLTLAPLFGAGGLVASIIGTIGLIRIARSKEELSGKYVALWCVTIGAIESVWLPYHVLLAIIESRK